MGKSVYKTMAFLRHEFIHLGVLMRLTEVSSEGPLSTPLNVVGFGHSHPVRRKSDDWSRTCIERDLKGELCSSARSGRNGKLLS